MKEDELKSVLLEFASQMATPGGISGLPKEWLESMEQIIEGL